jgi:acetyl-CoA acetyltransferase
MSEAKAAELGLRPRARFHAFAVSGSDPRGGAIALGHPFGGSGTKLMATPAELPRSRRRPLRPADHVRRRRHGRRRDHRAALTGAGGTFCAGMDLKAFLRGDKPSIEGRGFGGITMTPPRKPQHLVHRAACISGR